VVKAGPTEGHLDPTTEITLEAVKERAVKGVTILISRTFFLQLLSLVAIGLLGAFLTEIEFGVFFIVSAIINFLRYFSDIGLAAALIQTKEKVEETDLRTTFTIQQGLVLILLILPKPTTKIPAITPNRVNLVLQRFKKVNMLINK